MGFLTRKPETRDWPEHQPGLGLAGGKLQSTLCMDLEINGTHRPKSRIGEEALEHRGPAETNPLSFPLLPLAFRKLGI